MTARSHVGWWLVSLAGRLLSAPHLREWCASSWDRCTGCGRWEPWSDLRPDLEDGLWCAECCHPSAIRRRAAK